MAEAQENPGSAYHKVVFTFLPGATPSFAWGGARVTATCEVPSRSWLEWWNAACQLLEQVASVHPRFAAWSAQAVAARANETPFDPLGTGWRALLTSLGMPDYPWQLRVSNRDVLVWNAACPYDEAAKLSMMLTCDWLNRSYDAWHLGEAELRRAQLGAWCDAFDRLAALLPSPADMALHHELWERGIAWEALAGKKIRIGEGSRQAVVEDLKTTASFDDPDRWRVPIYTVTGSIGKTTTARLLWQLLRTSGQRLALTASDGAWIGETRVAKGDCIGGITAKALLRNPRVDAAVFEQGRGGLLHQGVPYARSDIGVLLNVDAVHLGADDIETVEEMAKLKAHGLLPARIAVLNFDDVHCQRIGAMRSPKSCVWFSTTATAEAQQEQSRYCFGTAGIEREPDGTPSSIVIWTDGKPEKVLSLAGVAPYQGLLGEKTLEELLAVICAAWFGPLPIEDWDLRKLRLDGSNHLFRTSVHRLGNIIYVLDKAGEEASLKMLGTAIKGLAAHEAVDRRIVVLARSAGETPERHLQSARLLYGLMDEFICFDRPETYMLSHALPNYRLGSIPLLLRDEFERLNSEHCTAKPVTVLPDWTATETHLQSRLPKLGGKTLVLINQPATASYGLNERIVGFVNGHPIAGPVGPE